MCPYGEEKTLLTEIYIFSMYLFKNKFVFTMMELYKVGANTKMPEFPTWNPELDDHSKDFPSWS